MQFIASLTKPEQFEKWRSPEFQSSVLVMIVGIMMAPVIVRTTADPDLWGHLRFGLDILETRTLPRVDPYSFTQDIPWTNHEWLSELIMALAYKAAGSVGLVFLKSALVATFLALVLGAYAGTPLIVRGAIALMVLWGAGSIVATLRPQLWTLVGVALLCRLLMTSPQKSWLLAMPVIFMLWVNLHGGWIVGAGLLAVWTGGQLLWPQASRGLIAGVAVCSAVATLINPYGWHMWEFLGETVRLSRDISEWKPLFLFPVWDWLPWVVAMLVVIAAVFSRHRPPLDRLAMIAMLAYASVRVIRIAPLCITAAMLLIRPTVATWLPTHSLTFTPLTRAAARGLAAGIVGVAVVSAGFITRAATCMPITGQWEPDTSAGRTLAEARRTGKIVTWFDWGQYALWHTSPALRVSMDGRRETIYSADLLKAHFALYEATPEGIRFFQRLDPDYVWLPNTKARLRDWLVSHGYRVDVQTPESFIAVREGLEPLRQLPASTTACFPGP